MSRTPFTLTVQTDPATLQLLQQSAPFQLAQQLQPSLNGITFAIGGSLLLLELGLLNKARDLDLVCSLADFPQLKAALAASLSPVAVPPHPQYQTEAFARFVSKEGVEVDVMAGIRVQQSQQLRCWQFRPERLEWRHQLPWMLAEDWLELYQLFQRPKRVQLLQRFLAQR
ncbi:hypothetical protein [Rheinheimera sp. 4Y26]|uniref:hypothetical protein n=1 Tax=Rheinheimera sp. 4Y26 TaxID=2977811 RepID=UPI0021B0DD7C|nr:hypothetical protein [Rheinheimera sp. 4Y26]MCT6698543.1 hypothetical protein [Rheinheimera sp. 4Y26]